MACNSMNTTTEEDDIPVYDWGTTLKHGACDPQVKALIVNWNLRPEEAEHDVEQLMSMLDNKVLIFDVLDVTKVKLAHLWFGGAKIRDRLEWDYKVLSDSLTSITKMQIGSWDILQPTHLRIRAEGNRRLMILYNILEDVAKKVTDIRVELLVNTMEAERFHREYIASGLWTYETYSKRPPTIIVRKYLDGAAKFQKLIKEQQQEVLDQFQRIRMELDTFPDDVHFDMEKRLRRLVNGTNSVMEFYTYNHFFS